VSERDLDAEFERIIAGWDDEAPDPQPHLTSNRDPLAPDVTGATDSTDSTGLTDATDATEVTDETSATTASEGSQVDQAPAPDGIEARDGVSGEAGTLGAPAPPAGQAGGVLGLPIAPATPHAWRGGEPQRDDADDLLDSVDPDEDHFVPPSEIDLPSAETDPMYWAIVGGLVGGPLLLLYVLLFDRDGSGWWIVTGLTMLVVGFVLLVLRGGSERDPFDDGTRV
jgi:hypothetical protein